MSKKNESVFYVELRPEQFRRRIARTPIAYLPLGTLEWHGEHLPLGADGIQSSGFFEILADRLGGIILPMLFLGPDQERGEENGKPLYGMDVFHGDPESGQAYESGQLAGSAYRIPDEQFDALLDSIVFQLVRAGFRIIVGHGHGPSTKHFRDLSAKWEEQHGIRCFNCHGSPQDKDALGIQVDHAAKNETSLTMALRPELVDLGALPVDPKIWPRGVGGRDPRQGASAEFGRKALEIQANRMEKMIAGALEELGI